MTKRLISIFYKNIDSAGVGVIAQVEGDGRLLPPDAEVRDEVMDVIVRKVMRTQRPEKVRLSDNVTSSVTTSTSSTSEAELDTSTEISEANNASFPQCPGIPPGLEGRLEVNLTVVPMDTIINENPMVMLGGENSPEECRARDNVAIIVPYRF